MIDTNLLATIGALLGLAVLLVIGAWIIQHTHAEVHGQWSDKPEDLLKSLEAAYQAGQMDEEEFERVRRTLEQPVVPSELRREDSPPSGAGHGAKG